jgi:hypothetical protein
MQLKQTAKHTPERPVRTLFTRIKRAPSPASPMRFSPGKFQLAKFGRMVLMSTRLTIPRM